MFSLKLAIVFFAVFGLVSSKDYSFTYNGFSTANLSLDGVAEFTTNGLLKLTNNTKQEMGHAFFPNPINSFNTTPFSFSTSFVFAIQSQCPSLSGHGIAFVIAPTRGLPGALPSQFLGLFNDTDNGDATNHVVAVELDTVQSKEFYDINDNHVGIDINGLRSMQAATAGYYSDSDGSFRNLILISGKPMQAWVEYDGVAKQLNVTLALVNVGKPLKPLLSYSYDLSLVINQTMYVGFSSSTGSAPTTHFVLGWSFRMNGVADPINLSNLLKLPWLEPKPKSKFLTIGLPIILITSFSIVIAAAICHIRRKRKYADH